MMYFGEKMVAPPEWKGTHRTGYTDYKAKPAKRDSNGVAKSKILRKRERALAIRQKGWAAAINGNPTPPEGAFRKPGSMTK